MSSTVSSRAQSFRAMFEAEVGYVCRVLRRLGVHERDVEDVAQDVFVAVYRRMDSYDPSRPLRPWLFGFAYHNAANYARLARHRIEAPMSEALDRRSSPELDATRSQDRTRVLVGLAAIPLERRSVLILHDIDGFPAPEIAASLSIPLNTVYSRLRVARAELREALGDLRTRGEP